MHEGLITIICLCAGFNGALVSLLIKGRAGKCERVRSDMQAGLQPPFMGSETQPLKPDPTKTFSN